MSVMMNCPLCQCKSHAAASSLVTENTRETYHQCKNLNCGRVFVSHTTITRLVPITGEKPDPDLQPYLINKRRAQNKKNSAKATA